ncbi:MAG: hypothetical protein GX548_06155 [Lentisphaerae bacterium]|nr:hypothetical protein [Lentisphaerota bacterium]
MEENVLMMRCAKCGEMNRLPVVHCKKCGAKLDFDAAEKQMKNAGEATFADHVRLFVKMGVAIVLAVVVLLAIWPGRMTRAVGEPIDARRYRVKTELLVDALNRGMPASQVLTEREINAHLKELIAAQPARKGWAPGLDDIGVRFSNNRAEVFVSIARGPFTFTSLYKAPVKNSIFRISGARLGHLPLPGILGRLYGGMQTGLFRQLKNESRILRNLDGASISGDSVELLVTLGQ